MIRTTILVVLLLFPMRISAQQRVVATPFSKITMDMGEDNLEDVQKGLFKYYLDSSLVGVKLDAVTCLTNKSVVTCTAPFPKVSVGFHSITTTFTAIGGVESAKTPVLAFTYSDSTTRIKGVKIQ